MLHASIDYDFLHDYDVIAIEFYFLHRPALQHKEN